MALIPSHRKAVGFQTPDFADAFVPFLCLAFLQHRWDRPFMKPPQNKLLRIKRDNNLKSRPTRNNLCTCGFWLAQILCSAVIGSIWANHKPQLLESISPGSLTLVRLRSKLFPFERQFRTTFSDLKDHHNKYFNWFSFKNIKNTLTATRKRFLVLTIGTNEMQSQSKH